jgi:hypothetical protein
LKAHVGLAGAFVLSGLTRPGPCGWVERLVLLGARVLAWCVEEIDSNFDAVIFTTPGGQVERVVPLGARVFACGHVHLVKGRLVCVCVGGLCSHLFVFVRARARARKRPFSVSPYFYLHLSMVTISLCIYVCIFLMYLPSSLCTYAPMHLSILHLPSIYLPSLPSPLSVCHSPCVPSSLASSALLPSTSSPSPRRGCVLCCILKKRVWVCASSGLVAA